MDSQPDRQQLIFDPQQSRSLQYKRLKSPVHVNTNKGNGTELAFRIFRDSGDEV